jgi:hypothetical protein
MRLIGKSAAKISLCHLQAPEKLCVEVRYAVEHLYYFPKPERNQTSKAAQGLFFRHVYWQSLFFR